MASRYRWLLAVAALVGAPAVQASDVDFLGIYAGAALGQARDTYTVNGLEDPTRLGWKAMLGLRPIPFLGAEVEYTDFGTPHISEAVGGPFGGGFFGTVHTTAAGVFAVAYLPVLPSLLSLYAKGGAERVHNTVNGEAPCRAPALCIALWNPRVSESDAAYGAGVQTQFAAIAIRAEYERTDSKVGHPNLLSLGATWTF